MKLYHSTAKDFDKFYKPVIAERFWQDRAFDKLGFWFSPSKRWCVEFARFAPNKRGFIKTIKFNKRELRLFIFDSDKISSPVSNRKCWIIKLRNDFTASNLFYLRTALQDNGFQGIRFVKPYVDNYLYPSGDFATDQYCIFDEEFINKHLEIKIKKRS